MLKLPMQDQDWFVRDHGNAFGPAAGSWGRQGSTIVQLRDADPAMVRLGMIAAWRGIAPKTLAQRYVDE